MKLQLFDYSGPQEVLLDIKYLNELKFKELEYDQLDSTIGLLYDLVIFLRSNNFDCLYKKYNLLLKDAIKYHHGLTIQ